MPWQYKPAARLLLTGAVQITGLNYTQGLRLKATVVSTITNLSAPRLQGHKTLFFTYF